MSYIIGFGTKNNQEITAASAPTAHQALAIVEELQNSGQEIKFISSPQEGEIGIEMLRVLEKEEAEEMPKSLKKSA